MAKKEIKSTDEFIKGLWRDNPVFIQMLGLCPALAVTKRRGALFSPWRVRLSTRRMPRAERSKKGEIRTCAVRSNLYNPAPQDAGVAQG